MSDSSRILPEPIKVDFSSDSACMVITFGSLRLRTEIPPFEWTVVVDQVPSKRIFTRELYQRWYLRGMPGIGDSPEEVAGLLRNLINEQQCRRVVTLGSSMGGYAAFLFGYLLEADKAIAVAPQTFLPTRKFDILGRPVLRKKWRILWRYWQLVSDKHVNRKYFDLRPLIMNEGSRTEYHLYYSPRNLKDRIHAKHLQNLANVALHERSNGGHLVVRMMRDSGELERILLDATAVS